jgi:hypothetical protein
MRSKFAARHLKRGSAYMLLMVMIPLFLVPLIGLAIDGTMCYIVQAKLSSAVDGAALGAGRLLGTKADTGEIAGEFLNVNFPDGYWGAKWKSRTITPVTNLGSHTITISASVSVPLLFMRVIGQKEATVSAGAVATRKDTRVVIVMDRSNSLNNPDATTGNKIFPVLKASVLNFVSKFRAGTDELGLVVFSDSGVVAYPTGTYSSSVSGGGGPDVSWNTSTSGKDSLPQQITKTAADGWTGMAEGLSLGYIELQKAHYRDLAANGSDTTLNAIVLFSDGIPNTIAVSPNLASSNALKTKANGGKCTWNPATLTTNTMRGWAVAVGPGKVSQGLYLLSQYDTTRTLNYKLANAGYEWYNPEQSQPSAATAGCVGLGNGGSSFALNELAKVPDYDYYGVPTTGSQYGTSNQHFSSYDPTAVTTYNTWAVASWNTADNAGRVIRTQSAMNEVIIYTIGYNANSGYDPELLRRLANTQTATSYTQGQPVGKYYEVTVASQLDAAFQDVASEILRLSK